MDDLKDQSAVSTTATNGVVESEEVRAQEALLGDTDPSLTSADDVAKALNVDPSHGLSEEEAKRRLAKFGPNELASAPPVPKWKKFLAQFQDPLVYLLIAATIISVIAWFIEKANAQPGAEGGEVLPFDAIVIILILIVNAVLGYMQEAKAEAAVEALAQMTAPQTSVLRDDKVMRINTADVVPGDIIVLAEGDSVSADGRLVNAASLRIAEASLTGESVPVGKKPDTLTEAKALGDRANMIFNGTSVTQGTGRAIVTGTGMNTQVGKIADMLSATEDEKTPLQKEMDYVSKILGIAVCVIAVVVLVALAVLEGFNDVHDVIDSLLLAVSLAVAAVPEGLAAILTVVLALGVQRMAAHNAIVKKLHSVETLGSASVICSDKTGTLTRNEMTVERVVTPSGEVQITGTGYAPEGRMVMTGGVSPESEQAQIVADEVVATLVAGTLANDGELREENGRWEIVGDPTEVSLIVAARKVKADRKIKRYTRVGEIPFTSERKRMSIIAKDSTDSDKLTVFAKGAPDVLLSYCTRIRVGGQVRKLTEGDRQSILATVERLSSEAYRTLGEACRPLETGSLADVPGVSVNAAGQVSDIADQAEAIETDLIWNGMVGIIDPPRTEVRDSVTEAHRAGIRTVMITGDQVATACAVARQIGILGKGGQGVYTGAQIDAMNQRALCDACRTAAVFARVTPAHKLRIVRAMKENGEIVAMTGDGVNDAPAVKEANIGVAMGESGTDVTREAAQVILLDDNFATLAAAVEEGRVIYQNIRRFLRYLLSCNTGEVITMFVGMLMGMPVILTPIQLLLVNLVTDGLPAISLGLEPAEPDVMRRPPRDPDSSIFAGGLMGKILFRGIVIGLTTLGVFSLFAARGEALVVCRTAALLTLVMTQLFHVFECRSETRGLFELNPFGNPMLLASGIFSAACTAAAGWTPACHEIFMTAPLSIEQFGMVLLCSLAAPAASSISLWISRKGKPAPLTGGIPIGKEPEKTAG